MDMFSVPYGVRDLTAVSVSSTHPGTGTPDESIRRIP